MNRNQLLIALSESDQTEFGRVDFSLQSDEQKVFSAIWELESQVNNGGFIQYFQNHSGETANFAPYALLRIKAHRCAAIVSESLRIVSPDPLPADHEERNAIIDSLDPAVLARLDELDADFFAYPDNLTDLLFEFVRTHSSTFGPVE